MGHSDAFPFVSRFGHIIVVLVLESFDGLIELEFIFALNSENFLLQFSYKAAIVIFRIFVVFELSFVAFDKEVDLIIFFLQSIIKVVNFLHEGIFDKLCKFSDI